MKSRQSRPVEARRAFIEAVTEEAKALSKDYDHEVAKGLWPLLEMAKAMLTQDVEKARKRAGVRDSGLREAAE